MPDLLLLGQADVRRLLDLDALLEALSAAFVELTAGRTSVPARTAARSESGLLGVMPGFLPGAGLEVKLVSVFPRNHHRGLPGHQALIVLFDPDTGTPQALMDGTHITAARTAAAAALATRLLASEKAGVLAILGAGVQGAAHLEAMPRVRDFREIRIASRNPENAQALAGGHPLARAAASFEAAAQGADVVCCCTDSPEPILKFAWLRQGTHVTSVGANINGPELDRASVEHGSLFVESRAAFLPPPAGSAELQGLDADRGTELGEVISGARPGRRSDEEITVYKSMGHAVEDAAAAALVYGRALREGAGQTFAV